MCLIEKNRDMGSEKYVSTKTAKLVMFRSNFSRKGVCSKFVTKTLYRTTVLVSECIFKLVCNCESRSLSEIG